MVRLQVDPTTAIKTPAPPAPVRVPVARNPVGYAQQAIFTGATLFAADVIAIVLTITCAASVLLAAGSWNASILYVSAGTSAATLFILYILGMYPAVGMHPAIELRGTILAACAGGCAHLLLTRSALLPGSWIASLVAGGILLVAFPLGRSLARTYASGKTWWGIRAIVVGSGDQVESLHAELRRSVRRGLRPAGWMDRDIVIAESNQLDTSPDEVFQERLISLSNAIGAHWVILVLDEEDVEENAHLLRLLQQKWVHTTIVYGDTAMILPSVHAHSIEIAEASGLHVCNRLLMPGAMFVKRSLDLFLAGIVALFAIPVALLLTLLIKFTSAGPAFYSQERVGRSGKKFRAWKFRTMVSNADEVLESHLEAYPELRAEWDRDHKLKNDPRITRLGRLLRKTSLDELPQLWNILCGEMSLVGPRPIVAAEIQKYGIDYRAYSGVLPGVTGLWQISGRNNTTYDERVRLDAYYVRNWSPWLDFYILVRTLKVVLTQEGAY